MKRDLFPRDTSGRVVLALYGVLLLLWAVTAWHHYVR